MNVEAWCKERNIWMKHELSSQYLGKDGEIFFKFIPIWSVYCYYTGPSTDQFYSSDIEIAETPSTELLDHTILLYLTINLFVNLFLTRIYASIGCHSNTHEQFAMTRHKAQSDTGVYILENTSPGGRYEVYTVGRCSLGEKYIYRGNWKGNCKGEKSERKKRRRIR